MDEKTAAKLRFLADKYETRDFLKRDPSQFMHRYQSPLDQETVAFLAASLSFGRREQILLHIERVLQKCQDSPYEWIISGKFNTFFIESEKSFYRMYSYKDMRILCKRLQEIFLKSGSMGTYIKEKKDNFPYLFMAIQDSFPKECRIIPSGKQSASKRIQMFLRWMVRKNSPVDLGLWDCYQASDLIIPLDTHVMQEATKLKLLSASASGKVRAASLKTALELTAELALAFPQDPVRGDYALFGLGVDEE